MPKMGRPEYQNVEGPIIRAVKNWLDKQFTPSGICSKCGEGKVLTRGAGTDDWACRRCD